MSADEFSILNLVSQGYPLIYKEHYELIQNKIMQLRNMMQYYGHPVSIVSATARIKFWKNIVSSVYSEHMVKISLSIALRELGHVVKPELEFPIVKLRPDITVITPNNEIVCIEAKNKILNGFSPRASIWKYSSICDYIFEITPAEPNTLSDVSRYFSTWLRNIAESYKTPEILNVLNSVGIALLDPITGRIYEIRKARYINTSKIIDEQIIIDSTDFTSEDTPRYISMRELIGLRQERITIKEGVSVIMPVTYFSSIDTIHELVRLAMARYMHEREYSVVPEVSLPKPVLSHYGQQMSLQGLQRIDLIAFNEKEIIGIECKTAFTKRSREQLSNYRKYFNKLYLAYTNIGVGTTVSLSEIQRYVDKVFFVNPEGTEIWDENMRKIFP